jgi:hypothetical protein
MIMDDVVNTSTKRQVLHRALGANQHALNGLRRKIDQVEVAVRTRKSPDQLRHLTRETAYLWGELKSLQVKQMELLLQLEQIEATEAWLVEVTR